MKHSNVQGDFFSGIDLPYNLEESSSLYLKKETLKNWQKSIQRYQSKLFQHGVNHSHQYSFFDPTNTEPLAKLDPLKLTPLPLNFWRWPKSDHNGPAIYLVMDKPKNNGCHLLLYIGETYAADKRWKGEHDCKNYLIAYEEAFKKAGLSTQLSIRFWTDVPKETKSRRKLEQQLIQEWLPPFNKETRNRWGTPFTSLTH